MIADIPITPSTHRQRVGETASIGLSTVPGLVVGTPRISRNGSHMMNTGAPLGEGFQGGLRSTASFPTAGVNPASKFGQSGGSLNETSAPVTRSRSELIPEVGS